MGKYRGESYSLEFCLRSSVRNGSRESKRGRKRSNGRARGNRRGGTLGISVYRSGKGVTGASPTVTGAQVVSPRATKRDSEFELLRFCCTTCAAAIANCLPVHSRYLLCITIRFVAGLAIRAMPMSKGKIRRFPALIVAANLQRTGQSSVVRYRSAGQPGWIATSAGRVRIRRGGLSPSEFQWKRSLPERQVRHWAMGMPDWL